MNARLQYGYPLLLGIIFIVAYLLTQSISYDDFDSYSFGLAIEQFDLTLQQPQPPGFPIYILLAQGLHYLVQNPLHALTILSAISGAGAVVMLFFLGKQLFHHAFTAFWVALLFGLMPIQWLTSVKALSDATGLVFAVAALALLWAGLVDKPRWFIIGAFVLGLGLGVRPQGNIAVMLLYGVGVMIFLIQRKNWRIPSMSLVALGVGVALWLIPTLQSVGGLDRYLALIAQHGEHVGTSDSLFSTGTTLMARVNDLLETFLLPTFGMSIYRPLGIGDVAMLITCGTWLIVGCAFAPYRKPTTWAVVVWFLVMFIPYFLFTSLNRPRLMLPILPPLLLWACMGWEHLLVHRDKPYRIIGGAGIVVLCGVMLSQSVPLAHIIRTIPAPHDQATAYIRATYPSGQTAVAVAGSFRAAQVELSDYRALFYRYQFDPVTVQAQIQAEQFQYIAILDRDGFSDVITVLDDDGRYVPIDDRLFYRDARVHWEHHQTRLQVLMPLDQLTADRLMLPADGRITIAEDGRFLGNGWFRPEEIGGVMARWGGDSLISQVRVTLVPQDYHIEFFATPFADEAHARVLVDGIAIGEVVISGGWQSYRITLPAHLLSQDGLIRLEFAHDTMQSPYEQTQGGSSDRRNLTVAYAWIQFVPAP